MSYVKLQPLLERVWRVGDGEAGQALAETALIIAFVALVCVLALTAVGAAVVGGIEPIVPGLGG
jgi:Flp pilus assembly pilin Flp